MADKNNIQIFIDAVDRTKPAFNILKGRLGELATEANILSGTFTKTFSSMSSAAGIAITAIGAIAGVTLTFAKKAGEAAEAIDNLSETTGMTIPLLKELKKSAEVIGVDFDAVSSQIVKFINNLIGTGEKAKEVSYYLEAMGIDAKTAGDDMNKTLIQLAVKFAELEKGSNKTKMSVALFGRDGARSMEVFLTQLIATAGGIDKLTTKLRPLTEEEQKALDAAKEFDDKLDRLSGTVKRLGITIGNILIPAINAVLQSLGLMGPTLDDRLKSITEKLYRMKSAPFLDEKDRANIEATQKELDILITQKKALESEGGKIPAPAPFTGEEEEEKGKKGKGTKALDDMVRAGQEAADALRKAYDEIFDAEATELEKSKKMWQEWALNIEALLIQAGMAYQQRQELMVKVNAIAQQKIIETEIEAAQRAEDAWNEMEQTVSDIREKALKERAETALVARDIELQIKEFIAEQSEDELSILRIEKERLRYEIDLKIVKKEGVDLSKEDVEYNNQLMRLYDAQASTIDKRIIKEQRMRSGPVGAMAQAWMDINEEAANYINTGKMMYESTIAGVDGMIHAVNEFFECWISGSASAGEAFKRFAEEVLTLIAKMIIQFIILSVVKALGGGSPTGAVGGNIPFAHAGGAVDRFRNYRVKSFHSGGLSYDEVPVILQTGEGVISRKGMSNLERINTGKVGGNTIINMTVHAKDADSFRKSQTQIRADMARAITTAQRRNL